MRLLGVPLWWLAFPPLLQSIWNGNPQTIALALLVVGGSAAAAIAVLIKLYAAIPLLARPRSLVIAGIAVIVTLPILPWQLYLQDGLGISRPPGDSVERQCLAPADPRATDAPGALGPAP